MAVPFGKYQLLRRLAVGGMAEVFLGVAKGAGGFRKYVAIKRILPDLSNDDEFVDMFLDEARILASFNHPNIVQIFDLGRVGTSYYLAMEYVQGLNLARLFKLCKSRQERIPLEYAVKVVSDACDALGYAHSFKGINGVPLNLIHRDVSPHNVMLSTDGVVKVLDFGIAKAVGNLTRTRPSFLKGKAMFMSPEQIAMPDDVDSRSDIFSLGTMLYVLTTGQSPFKGKTELEVMMSVARDPAPDPRSHDETIPEELVRITLRALAKSASDRYQTAREMHEDLERFLFDRKVLVDKHILGRFLGYMLPQKEVVELSSVRPAEPSKQMDASQEAREQNREPAEVIPAVRIASVVPRPDSPAEAYSHMTERKRVPLLVLLLAGLSLAAGATLLILWITGKIALPAGESDLQAGSPPHNPASPVPSPTEVKDVAYATGILPTVDRPIQKKPGSSRARPRRQASKRGSKVGRSQRKARRISSPQPVLEPAPALLAPAPTDIAEPGIAAEEPSKAAGQTEVAAMSVEPPAAPSPASPAQEDQMAPQPSPAVSPQPRPSYQPPEVVAKRRVAGHDPVYPSIARKAKREAVMLVRIYIDPQGEVGELKFLKTDETFEGTVTEAIRSWRFRPHQINDRPVGTYTVYKFVFRLD